jgi:hypothetical protein
LVNQFSTYPLKFLLQLLVHEHQSFDSATQITVTSGDDLVHILPVLIQKTVGVCVWHVDNIQAEKRARFDEHRELSPQFTGLAPLANCRALR